MSSNYRDLRLCCVTTLCLPFIVFEMYILCAAIYDAMPGHEYYWWLAFAFPYLVVFIISVLIGLLLGAGIFKLLGISCEIINALVAVCWFMATHRHCNCKHHPGTDPELESVSESVL